MIGDDKLINNVLKLQLLNNGGSNVLFTKDTIFVFPLYGKYGKGYLPMYLLYFEENRYPFVALKYDGTVLSEEEVSKAFLEYWHNGFLRNVYNFSSKAGHISGSDDYAVYREGKYEIVTFIETDGNTRHNLDYGYRKKVRGALVIDRNRNKVVLDLIPDTLQQHVEYDRDNNVLYYIEDLEKRIITYSIKKDHVDVREFKGSSIIPVSRFYHNDDNFIDQWKYGTLFGAYIIDEDKNEVSFVTTANGTVQKIHIASRHENPKLFEYIDHRDYSLQYAHAFVVDADHHAFLFNFTRSNSILEHSDGLLSESILVSRSVPKVFEEYLQREYFLYPVLRKPGFSIYSIADIVTQEIHYAVFKNGQFAGYVPSLFAKYPKYGLASAVAYEGKKNFYIIEKVPSVKHSVNRYRLAVYDKSTLRQLKSFKGIPDRVLPWTFVQPSRYVGFINKNLIPRDSKSADAVFKLLDTETMKTVAFPLKDFLYVIGDRYNKLKTEEQYKESIKTDEINDLQVYVKGNTALIGKQHFLIKENYSASNAQNGKKEMRVYSEFHCLYYLHGNKVYTLFKREYPWMNAVPFVYADHPYTIMDFNDKMKDMEKEAGYSYEEEK
jgi:hypothetical protein